MLKKDIETKLLKIKFLENGNKPRSIVTPGISPRLPVITNPVIDTHETIEPNAPDKSTI